MGTIRRLSDIQLGSPSTSRVLNVTNLEIVYTIQSGNRAFQMTNLDSPTVYWGQSGVSVNSGNLLAGSGGTFFLDSVVDNFTTYFSGMSTSTARVLITEYAGN